MIDFEAFESTRQSLPKLRADSVPEFGGGGPPTELPDYLRRLNDKQREAALITDGPLIVLAGAGSGKTSMLTARIAWLVQGVRVPPYHVLAVTFTNKAAGE